MMKRIFLICALMFVAAIADEADLDWVRYYGSNSFGGYDACTAVAIDSSGNIYVSGTSEDESDIACSATCKFQPDGTLVWIVRSELGSTRDLQVDREQNVIITCLDRESTVIQTIKYAPDGTQIWTVAYNEGEYTQVSPVAMVLNSSGEIYITGLSFLDGSSDYLTIKYDSDGVEQWVARYAGQGSSDEAVDIAIDPYENVIVTGHSDNGEDLDYTTIKYNPEGTTLWVRHYNGVGNERDMAAAVTVDHLGDIYVTGTSRVAVGVDIVTLKYSAGSGLFWEQNYNNPLPDGEGEYGYNVEVDADRNVFVIGYAEGDYVILKYNTEGTLLWEATMPGPWGGGYGKSAEMTIDTNGNLYVAVCSWGNYLTAMYDPDGNQIWMTRFASPGYYMSHSPPIALDLEEQVIIAGEQERNYAIISYGLSGEEMWVQSYSHLERSWDILTDMIMDGHGNIYVTGASLQTNNRNNYLSMKLDTEGSVVWEHTYNDSGSWSDYPYAMTVDTEGNVYVTGASGWNFGTIKYDPDGNMVWEALFTGTGYELALPADIAVDHQGDVFITGSSVSDSGDYDITTIKYASDGATEWIRRYGNPNNGDDFGSKLVLDAAGNIIVAGSRVMSEDHSDFSVIKYSPDGQELWYRYFGESTIAKCWVTDMVLSEQGNILIAGALQTELGPDHDPLPADFCTSKLDPSGNLEWSAIYRGDDLQEDEDIPTALLVDAYENIYVTGTSAGNFMTIKYSSMGDELWAGRYIGLEGSYDTAIDIVQDQSGRIFVTGDSGGDLITLTYDSSGLGSWFARFNATESQYHSPRQIAIDDSGHIYIAGTSRGSEETGAQSVYTFVKYAPYQAIVSIDKAYVPQVYMLHNNTPNPFNPSTTISYELPSPSDVMLTVYDITGRTINTLAEAHQPAGTYSILWNGTDKSGDPVSTGVYFCRLRVVDPAGGGTGDYAKTIKMVYLK